MHKLREGHYFDIEFSSKIVIYYVQHLLPHRYVFFFLGMKSLYGVEYPGYIIEEQPSDWLGERLTSLEEILYKEQLYDVRS